MHLDGAHFSLDVAAPTPCAKDADCTFVARLAATDGFHVNDEYPYRLTMDPAANVTFPASGVFTKGAGDFRVEGKTTGIMTVRYRSAAAGAHAIAGTYKLSVCSEAKCQMETAKVSVTVSIR